MTCPFNIGDYVTPLYKYTSNYGLTGKVVGIRHNGSAVDIVFPGDPRGLCYGVNEVMGTADPKPPHPAVSDTLSKVDELIKEAETRLAALKAIRDAVSKVQL